MKHAAPSLSMLTVLLRLFLLPPSCYAFSSIRSSTFHGRVVESSQTWKPTAASIKSVITMRKQKASDRKGRRRQLGQDLETFTSVAPATITASPMEGSTWKSKTFAEKTITDPLISSVSPEQASRGRQRSRKRSTLYNSMSFYHNSFVDQLTFEYKVEVCTIHGCKGHLSARLLLDLSNQASENGSFSLTFSLSRLNLNCRCRRVGR
jgi:hypothetical protein